MEATKECTWPEGDVLVSLWCQVVTAREEFAKRIRESRGATPIIPLIPRTGTFGSPNALLSDLRDLIDGNRSLFCECSDVISVSEEPIVILLLCRTPFSLPRIASPMELPDWFPRKGGQVVSVSIQDFESTGQGQMSSPESRIEDMARLIYEVDKALLQRLVSVHKRDSRLLDGLRGDIIAPGEKLEAFMDSCGDFLYSVKNPQGFRPSLKENRSTVARLLRLVAGKSPDSLVKPARHLATALDVDESRLRRATLETLVAVLTKPSNPIDSVSTRGARAFLVTLYAAFQFTTAAAHSDDYPRFPLHLLRCVSRDIREGLDAFVSTLA